MCFLAQFFAGVIIVCLTMFVATLVGIDGEELVGIVVNFSGFRSILSSV